MPPNSNWAPREGHWGTDGAGFSQALPALVGQVLGLLLSPVPMARALAAAALSWCRGHALGMLPLGAPSHGSSLPSPSAKGDPNELSPPYTPSSAGSNRICCTSRGDRSSFCEFLEVSLGTINDHQEPIDSTWLPLHP